MISKVKKEISYSFVIAILLIILAIILLLNQDNFIKVVITLFGYISMFVGIIKLFSYFALKKGKDSIIKEGMLFLIFGCLTIVKKDLLESILTIILGGYFIYQACCKLEMVKLIKNKPMLIILATLILAFGILLFFPPILHPIANNTYIAILILLAESFVIISNIFLFFSLKNEV